MLCCVFFYYWHIWLHLVKLVATVPTENSVVVSSRTTVSTKSFLSSCLIKIDLILLLTCHFGWWDATDIFRGFKFS